MSYPLRPARNAVEYISSRVSVGAGPSTSRTGVFGFVSLNRPMMSRHTPVPSGSIRTDSSPRSRVPDILKLAANSNARMSRPQTFTGVVLKNMDLSGIDRNLNHIGSRTAAGQHCQRRSVYLNSQQRF